ncbi:carbohydrate sulfotransferase 12-like isoform X2 [Nerophis ophidion]|uniref:carbohydrate sulfotransferase 12-like isoform X2 n=1 Tax=Nerophis ophidion TaxID=159077 RepID=UPI002ADF98E8|nr:carbohydrate sulfotransferase 12-like isoform X2 [Nerophis ophidion]
MTSKKLSTRISNRYVLLLLTLVTYICVMVFYYHGDMSTGRAVREQELRKTVLRDACRENMEPFPQDKESSDNRIKTVLNQLLVDDEHGVIYCFINKVACTNWKRFMKALKEGEPYPDLMSISRTQAHNRKNVRTLASFSKVEMKHLLDPETNRRSFDVHWRQFYHLCQPCYIEYDFIGHQETLDEDALELLTSLNMEKLIKFPPAYENVTSPASLSEWFKEVPLKDRRKLYELYKMDYELFGYQLPYTLLNITQ